MVFLKSAFFVQALDSKRTTENPEVNRYRNRQHNTYIGNNGSIMIMEIKDNKVIINKSGRDKRKVDDL